MKKKLHFEAVRIQNLELNTTGSEVRAKVGGSWETICDTWAFGEEDAEKTAERIAGLLNDAPSKGEAALLKDMLAMILADSDLKSSFRRCGFPASELRPLLAKLERLAV